MRLTFRTFSDLHRETRLSNASKSTSLVKVAKLRISNEVKVSGKKLNQSPPRSIIEFSCMSNSVKFLQNEDFGVY